MPRGRGVTEARHLASALHTDLWSAIVTLFGGRRFYPPVSLQSHRKADEWAEPNTTYSAKQDRRYHILWSRWVELMGRYSNFSPPLLSRQIDHVIRSVKSPELPKSPAPRVHAVHRRLSPDAIQQLITDYQAGTPSTQLMLTYRLGKGTVLRLLREHGVQLRNQRMTPAEVEQAIQLYGQGLSLATVGQQLGYDHGTIWQALKRAGVPRRDTHGRSADPVAGAAP